MHQQAQQLYLLLPHVSLQVLMELCLITVSSAVETGLRIEEALVKRG